MLKNLLMKC